MNSSEDESQKPAAQDIFATTRWTVVLSAGHKSSPHSDRALAELCQTYWYPLMVKGQERSADWQSAVSRAGSPLGVLRPFADCQSAIQPTASRRYRGAARTQNENR